MFILRRMHITSNSKVVSFILKPNTPIFVLILDLIVKFEIFNKDADESSVATEVREATKNLERYDKFYKHARTCYLSPYTWTLC